MSSDYRLAPAFGARLVGLLVVGRRAARCSSRPAWSPCSTCTRWCWSRWRCSCWRAIFAVGGVVRGATVVHFDDDGYRVRLIRGAGVKQASWTDVAEAVDVAAARRPLRGAAPAGRPHHHDPGRRRGGGPGGVRPRPARPSAARARAPAARRALIRQPSAPACSLCWLSEGGRRLSHSLRHVEEASPSPVYGARLLSGLRAHPSRGFKSRRLRQPSIGPSLEPRGRSRSAAGRRRQRVARLQKNAMQLSEPTIDCRLVHRWHRLDHRVSPGPSEITQRWKKA